MSIVRLYLLLTPNLLNFTWKLNNAHKTINTHLQSLWSTGLWSITDYWGNWGIPWVSTLLVVTYPKKGVTKKSNCQPSQPSTNAFWIFLCYSFKPLVGRQHQPKLYKCQKLPSEINSNISIDSQLTYLIDKNCQCDIILGDFLDKFGFTINYH